jgi:hypothetical protein
MGRLLSYHSASTGNTFPAIDTLLELHRRGHESTCAHALPTSRS